MSKKYLQIFLTKMKCTISWVKSTINLSISRKLKNRQHKFLLPQNNLKSLSKSQSKSKFLTKKKTVSKSKLPQNLKSLINLYKIQTPNGIIPGVRNWRAWRRKWWCGHHWQRLRKKSISRTNSSRSRRLLTNENIIGVNYDVY